MSSKNLQIIFIFLIILLSVDFLSASDSQLYQSCGGDSQLTFGCLGDSQLSFTGAVAQEETQPPTLTITKPKNQTYFNTNSLKVQVNTNGNNVWYRLDSGENITIKNKNSANFDASEGSHTIYVFANNSIGTTAKNVTFLVDTTKLKINHTEFSGSDKGETTNFNEYSYEEMQDLSNVVLEKTSKGKIKFTENINFTDDLNPEDNSVNLDDNIIISDNKIEINSTALPNFNKPATLFLYELPFANPRILMDGSLCPASVCTEVDYTGGTLEFTVTHFTTYSTEESPAAPVTAQATGGGGGHECYSNSDCTASGYGVCWNHNCITGLFDVKIISFESPVKLGDFFNFTYSLKDMANINSDVNVDFWIEKDNKNITSGSEVIYVGGLKEVTQAGKLFIPESLESGTYTFYVKVSNDADIAEVHRTIQISVEGGIATIIPVPESPNLGWVIIVFSIVIALLVIFFIILYLRQKARINGLQNILEGFHVPYLKARSRFQIFRNRMRNRRQNRIAPYYTKQVSSIREEPEKEQETSHYQPETPRLKKLSDFRPRTVQELLDEAKRRDKNNRWNN